MGMNSDYWMRGEVSELARELEVSPQYVHDVICGRRNLSLERAKLFAHHSERIGKRIPSTDWMCTRDSRHMAFAKRGNRSSVEQ